MGGEALGEAFLLLLAAGWDVDEAVARYLREPEQFRRDAGVAPIGGAVCDGGGGGGSAAPPICLLCAEPVPADAPTAQLRCGHVWCHECVSGQVCAKLDDANVSALLPCHCLSPGCRAAFPPPVLSWALVQTHGAAVGGAKYGEVRAAMLRRFVRECGGGLAAVAAKDAGAGEGAGEGEGEGEGGTASANAATAAAAAAAAAAARAAASKASASDEGVPSVVQCKVRRRPLAPALLPLPCRPC